ncbi:NACHT, LRR and PYD domains-containing protein 14 [Holothuria leucospilota]|uniref:NACHT, LRR and PYD domains-containing protein 14 n=1 Tax=Holothuria leucospilota TaxID=206669 RepID=A0A9Q1CTA2_HOLLE|nr:NACHT, LRR and PYD domains-containing protein 14 [Holothuria leucospilota]
MISCTFPSGFYGLYWYNSSESRTSFPFISLVNGSKSGPGYESGEYNVSSNGSLIINNVSLRHEHQFRTVMLYFESKGATEVRDVTVIVTAIPTQQYPLLDGCETKRICYNAVDYFPVINCTVKNARPAVMLKWALRTHSGDKNVTTLTHVATHGSLFTTSVQAQYFNSSLSIALFVCKEISTIALLTQTESLLLMEIKGRNISTFEQVKMFVQLHSKTEMTCSDGSTKFLVWKAKVTKETTFRPISYTILDEQITPEVLWKPDNFIVDTKGSLMIASVGIDHEGVYSCVFSDGVNEGSTSYEVSAIVPAYPVVQGCNPLQYCVLSVPRAGHLNCSVKGIRPQVTLEWRQVVSDDFDASILFLKDKLSILSSPDGTYDILLTSEYDIQMAGQNRLTVECKISEKIPGLLNTGARLDLVIIEEYVTDSSNEIDGSVRQKRIRTFGIALAIFTLLVMSATLVIIMVKVLRKRTERPSTEADGHAPGEEHAMMPQDGLHNPNDQKIGDLKKMFIKQLQERYKILYEAIQPIPYIRDRLFCVDRVFVEGGIEYMVSKEPLRRKEEWGDLETYKNILEDPRVKSTRRILEGDPGYGKSTLTLQLAFDWCEGNCESFLKRNVEILIILRLRQLGGVSSIYRAVKQFLLPKESCLQCSDIERIMTTSKSVLVVLDGFDEFPDQSVESKSDVMKIITSEMFPTYEVILTTRSSCLPKEPMVRTKRMRLTGFDEKARDEYIRKAVVYEGNEDQKSSEIKKVRRCLRENVVLGDLCQVPLFFVMFAHMTHEGDNFKEFNSVTTFFRYMITCFHSHMKNKLKVDKNARRLKQLDQLEECHSELDRIAFEGLSKNDQQLVWKREALVRKLGKQFYKHYVSIGILVEEEVLEIDDSPGRKQCEHIQYVTEVRFYHKLFCEWYAAHYLGEYLSQTSYSEYRKVLIKLDPFDLQYTFRFACGLNPGAAEKIIDYLNGHEDASKFAILCILEQTGKIDTMKETIRTLCLQDITFKENDNKLLQRTTIQIMKIASDSEIRIRRLRLLQCFTSANPQDEVINLSSGLPLPRLSSLKELVISEPSKEFTDKEVEDVLRYCSSCLGPDSRCTFTACVLPRKVQNTSLRWALKERKIEVEWGVIKLNLETGFWREGRRDQTEAEYEEKVQFVRNKVQRKTFTVEDDE